MKVIVVGKCDISFLVENTANRFSENGHIVEDFNTRLYRTIDMSCQHKMIHRNKYV